jgi:hypothetical protein
MKGKPDALVRLPSGDLIPVERKKSQAPKQPYDGDLIPAAAYCILIEETYGRTPPFMRVQNADRWFDEPYTAEAKPRVRQTITRIRRIRKPTHCDRSHQIRAKCRSCGQRKTVIRRWDDYFAPHSSPVHSSSILATREE